MWDAWMSVRTVAGVGGQVCAEEGGKVLVHDDGLQWGDDAASGGLKNVLIIPVRIDFPDSVGLQW